MNPIWKDFLIARQGKFLSETAVAFPPQAEANNNGIYALPHLAVLTVSGNDAAHFLQGQLTCNVNDISETKASLGAFCNAKGRVITTFFLVRINDAYAMILPADLLEKVSKKLQMYKLRADVALTDSRNDYCLIGLSIPKPCEVIALPGQDLETLHTDGWIVKLPSAVPRYLLIGETKTAMEQWSRLTGEFNFQPRNSDHWRAQDIQAGIPWLSLTTSEEFIPQMLNLDKLGGISFDKGCYTGQEIIARTHYLGKNKRELYLAETDATPAPVPNSGIFDQDGHPIGKVLQAETDTVNCKMLVVLPIEYGTSDQLMLEQPAHHAIRIIAS